MKKIFAVLLCLLMVVCFMPTMVFADEETATATTGRMITGATTQEELDRWAGEGAIKTEKVEGVTTVTLLKNFNFPKGTMPITFGNHTDERMILDLNGHSISSTTIVVQSACDLTIKDAKSGGKISMDTSTNAKAGFDAVINQKKLTIESGTFEAKIHTDFPSTGVIGSAIAGVETVINGGEFISNCSAINVTSGTTTVNGGTFTADTYGVVSRNTAVVNFPAETKATVISGKFPIRVGIYYGTAAGKVNIFGGSFEETNAAALVGTIGEVPVKDLVKIYGGTFTKSPVAYTDASASVVQKAASYAVGADATALVKNAVAGETLALLKYDSEITVPGDVTIVNQTGGSVTVNGIEVGNEQQLKTHTWDEGEMTTEPTYDKEGVKTYTCTGCGETKTEAIPKKERPYIPSTPSIPSDNVTNSGTTGTNSATTTADINTTASNGIANAVVDQTTADKIVNKATSNQSAAVVVDVTTSTGKAENTTVTLPTDTIQKIANQTEAEVTIKTDAAEVTLDQKAVEAVAAKAVGSNVEIVVEKIKDERNEMEFELKIVSNGVVIGEFDGGNVKVTVKLNTALAALKDAALTCVYIDDNGIYSKVGGVKNNDGTYTFITTHFSSYAIIAEEEADKIIVAQTTEAVKSTKPVTRTAMSKAKGRKAVKVYWHAKDGSELNFDGYEVYRSVKRYSGFGTKPIYSTTKAQYYNTAIKAGPKYYYKIRGYKFIDGEKVYTDWSTKAWRTVK